MTRLVGRTEELRAGPADSARGSRVFFDLGLRSASGVVLVALALGTAFVGGPAFGLVWWAAAVAICWEWQHLIGARHLRFRFLAGSCALSLAAPLTERLLLWPALAAIAVGAGLAAISAERDGRVLAAAGVVYAGALVVSVDLLRQSFPFGLESILWLFAVVWTTDIMAYLGGRLVGGPKLWPEVSPSKTWAGFLIGIGCGSLAGLAVAPAGGPVVANLVVGLLAGAVAQAGDLFESTLKRRFGVKDSGRLIPGHGGVMDRLDGFLAAAACVAILGVTRFGIEAPGAGLFVW